MTVYVLAEADVFCRYVFFHMLFIRGSRQRCDALQLRKSV